MRTRKCTGAELYSGMSACPMDLSKVKGALVVPQGYKLPANIDGEALEQACHADYPNRVVPIGPFVEYSKDGGEPQVGNVGYGPNKVTGVSARTDTYTTEEYNAVLAARLMKTMNSKYAAYFYDEDNRLYGLDDGTDQLAPIPMSVIFPNATPHPTSSNASTLEVKFAYKDARKAIENFNVVELDFDIAQFATGLVPVELKKDSDNKYHIVETFGGLDRTEDFAAAISTSATAVIGGITAATVDGGAISLTASNGATPKLKAPSALYAAGVKGIVGV